MLLFYLLSATFTFFILGYLCTISVPINHKALYYNLFTRRINLLQQFSVSFSNIFLIPYKVKHKDAFTNFIDTRVFSDPVIRYPIICASRLEIKITGSALVRINDFYKAANRIVDLDDCIDKHCKAQLRNQFSALTVDQIISKQPTIEQLLKVDLNKQLNQYGVEIISFVLSEVHLPSSITNAVHQVMAKQTQYQCLLLEAQNKHDAALKEIQTKTALNNFKRSQRTKFFQLQLVHLKALRHIDPQFDLRNYYNYKADLRRYSVYPQLKGSLFLTEGDRSRFNYTIPSRTTLEQPTVEPLN